MKITSGALVISLFYLSKFIHPSSVFCLLSPFILFSTTIRLRKIWCKEFFYFVRVRIIVFGGRMVLLSLTR